MVPLDLGLGLEAPCFGGVSKLVVCVLGVPITRIVVFGGLYWGPAFLEATTSDCDLHPNLYRV